MSDNFEMKISERVIKLESDITNMKTDILNIKEEVKVLGSIEKAITKLTTLMEVQTESIKSIHNEIKNTNCKVDKLEDKFQTNESKNMIDQRDVIKDVLLKWLAPIGFGGFVLIEILKVSGVIK
jgi:predicted RNase H-like nuclease (RuvC/YqgF family)